jgi:hypothetical protein
MLGLNYPEQILEKLKVKNIWSVAFGNFLLFNIIYFIHNLIENRYKHAPLKETATDQISLIAYYVVLILTLVGLFRISLSRTLWSLITQYLLATSILLSIAIILDMPVQILNYNLDIVFSLIESLIFFWLSWALAINLIKGKSGYYMLPIVMCLFYFPTIIRILVLTLLKLI